MPLPYRFRLYRIACIANLVLLGLVIVFIAWATYNKDANLRFSGELALVLAYLILHYKNDRIGLQLFAQYKTGRPVPKRQRGSIRIFWVLQLIMQAIVAFQMISMIKRYFLLISYGAGYSYWIRPVAVVSDILGLLCFVTAVICLINVWPFVTFVRRHHIAVKKAQRPGGDASLVAFEQFQ
jgi:hypothetical protein